MTPDAIIQQFEVLVQDSFDITTELFLLNQCKNEREASRTWAILIGVDTSQSASPSDTFQTAKTLPGDFFMPSPRGIYVGSDLIPYKQVPFESQIDYQSVTYQYFIDFYNGVYYLCGAQSQSGTIKFFYRRLSPQLALVAQGGKPWIFPTAFHAILVYDMAKKYFAADQGDKSKAWDDRWDTYMRAIEDQMAAWDDQIQMLALQNEVTAGARDVSGYPTIINMDSGQGFGLNG